jgi:hypothetical protein
VLHPYFDKILSSRLIFAEFSSLGAIPKVGIRIAIESLDPSFSAVNFHVDAVVKKTNVMGYLFDRWVAMCRKPSLVIRELKDNPGSPEALLLVLRSELSRLDDFHGGKNNWNSMFVAGLIVPDVASWIFSRLTTPGRLADGPLI